MRIRHTLVWLTTSTTLLLGGGALLAAPANADTPSVLTTTTVGTAPADIELFDGKLWVANNGGNSLSQIDPATAQVVQTVDVPGSVGTGPNDLSADGTAIWFTTDSGGNIGRLDPATGAVTLGFDSGANPDGVLSNGTYVWTANNDDTLTRWNIALSKVETVTIPGAISVDEMTFENGHLWVSDYSGNAAVELDAATGNVLNTVAVGGSPDGLATDGSSVWVANEDDATVTQIDVASATVTRTIPVGKTPKDITVGGGILWVANNGDGTVTQVDAATGAVLATIAVGDSPNDVAVANGNAWVSINGADSVVQLGTPTPTTTAPSAPTLARTGTAHGVLLGIAGSLLVLGAGLVWAGRRARPSRHQR